MPRLAPLPIIDFDANGLIKGTAFNDSYFSRDDGLAETKAVFLAGNRLPDAWKDTQQFVIGELGFGTGLNVLATWDLWLKNRPVGGTLHIMTVEGFLMEARDGARAHAHWPELGHLSQKLCARWPTRAFGTQRIWFAEDGVCLTFLIGPCQDVLASADFQADCWFLDGFSPARNPDMWHADVYKQLARLSKKGTRLATYSVAGHVRAGLSEVGFTVTREPGHGTKRQRLEGIFDAGQVVQNHTKPISALVIGGGIGGAAMADALTRRGVRVDLCDPDACATIKASGNPLALVIPRLDKGDTREAAFYRAAFLCALDRYSQMDGDCFEQTGAIERGEDGAALDRLADLLSDPPLPPSHVSAEAATGALVHERAGTAFPHAVLKHLKSQAISHPVAVARVEKRDGYWCALDDADHVIVRADICVIAAGTGLAHLCDLGVSLGARAGQLSWAKLDAPLPVRPVSGAGYGASFGDRLVFGASYERLAAGTQTPPPVSYENHVHNQAVLGKIAPELARKIDLTSASGRTSIRVTTPDQMPIAGPAPQGEAGLYVLGGLGSRGFSTAFLCAELIASQMCGEPSPVTGPVAEAIAPNRFLKRQSKKRA